MPRSLTFQESDEATACLVAAGWSSLGPVVSKRKLRAAPGAAGHLNGKDLTGWKIPVGDNGHWKIVDGVIDYDAGSEAEKDKNLWTEKAYKNFVARVDWRIKSTPYVNRNIRIVMPDGHDKLDENGKVISIAGPDSDSGFILRGSGNLNER